MILILYNSNAVKHSCAPCICPSHFSFLFLFFTALSKSHAFSVPSRATHNHPWSYMRRQTTKQEITTGFECSIRNKRNALFFIYTQQRLSLTLRSQPAALAKFIAFTCSSSVACFTKTSVLRATRRTFKDHWSVYLRPSLPLKESAFFSTHFAYAFRTIHPINNYFPLQSAPISLSNGNALFSYVRTEYIYIYKWIRTYFCQL